MCDLRSKFASISEKERDITEECKMVWQEIAHNVLLFRIHVRNGIIVQSFQNIQRTTGSFLDDRKELFLL
jgi:hypothetical protein